jgi:hypothetical protein
MAEGTDPMPGFDANLLATMAPNLSLSGFSRDDDIRCSSPDPSKYYSADSQALEGGDGRALSMIVGRRATIIARAAPNRGGGSLGINPHAPKNNKVRIIDIVEPQNSIEVDFNRLTPEIAEEAVRAVVAATEPPTDKNEAELRSIGIFHVMKELSKDAPPVPRTAKGLPVEVANDMRARRPGHPTKASAVMSPQEEGPASMRFGKPVSAAEFAAPAAPAVVYEPPPVPIALPSAAVPASPALPAAPPAPHQPPAQGNLALFNVAAPSPPPAVVAARQPQDPGCEPRYRVSFDFGQGDMGVPFHDVIIAPPQVEGAAPLLVLVFDERYRGMRYVPAAGTTQFSVYVEGASQVHLVQFTGVQFTQGHQTFTTYAIVQSRPK